ncbi:hypothetical protein [Methylobacterium nigriterrae]|uniref:hypothetical protein n=1 Tax=Methylobacterium nigriterrae TaxID=3127512 RepID=UPI0030136EAA
MSAIAKRSVGHRMTGREAIRCRDVTAAASVIGHRARPSRFNRRDGKCWGVQRPGLPTMSPASKNLLLQHREVVAVTISSGAFFAALLLVTWLIA